MKRSEQLAPLSRDHQLALEVALRLRRAEQDDVADAVERFVAFWREHGEDHFLQEEQALIPAFPAADDELQAGARRMLGEHVALREQAAVTIADSTRLEAARELGELLHDHVRFEERELFPLIEARLAPEALDRLALVLAGLRH